MWRADGALWPDVREDVARTAQGGERRRECFSGLPAGHEMGNPTPDTPENVMRASPAAPPRRESDWDCIRGAGLNIKSPRPIAING